MAVVMHQGLCAWVTLAALDSDINTSAAPTTREDISPLPPCPPASVQRDLVAAWTNLVVGTFTTQQEASP